MADDRQRKILKVCSAEFATTLTDDRLQVFRKFSYSLGPDVSELLEEILDHHEISDEDIESSLETLVVEYSKQDGELLNVSSYLTLSKPLGSDATMKVSAEILKRVYESLQEQGQQSDEKDLIDPESHLYIINAFEMPLWRWSQENGTFQKLAGFCAELRIHLNFVQGINTPDHLRIPRISDTIHP